MLIDKLEILLGENEISYGKLHHPRRFTAQETAEAARIPGAHMLKAIIVKLDGVLSMAVLPATQYIDLNQLKSIAGASTAELATEEEFTNLFPECETGAMPPLGNLYRIPVYVDHSVATSEFVAFNAGTHSTLIQMAAIDYLNLAKPTVARFTSAGH